MAEVCLGISIPSFQNGIGVVFSSTFELNLLQIRSMKLKFCNTLLGLTWFTKGTGIMDS